jgi:hypothetical protein
MMYQQLWGYKVEDKLYLGVREQKRLNTTGLEGAILYIFYQASCVSRGAGVDQSGTCV